MPVRKPHNMRHLTRVDGAWWVRFFKGTKMQAQASFADSKCGGRNGALRAAQAWRDATEQALAPVRSAVGLRSKPSPAKRSGCPVGISASLRRDRRKMWEPRYLVFSVAYTNAQGKKTNKVFQAGNIESITPADHRHAALTAQACRDEWVWCRTHGQRFNPAKYGAWRTDKLYPFSPPAS